jgi:1-acyl-sn-glycerol-3-phosphate acyltransferase
MTDHAPSERETLLAQRDPGYVAKALPFLKLAMRGYFRSEVRGMERVPDGGVLMVGNHSGGILAMDVPIIAVKFFETFGADRALYCLAHDMLFTGINGPIMRRFGFVPARRQAAQDVLASGAVTIVFPGGDYDSFRPTLKANTIDFRRSRRKLVLGANLVLWFRSPHRCRGKLEVRTSEPKQH